LDNAQQVRAAKNLLSLPAVVYVAVSTPEPGRVKHLARGDLIIGPPSEKTTEVANVFNRAGISCQISENIEGELWVKLLCNCALNAISALGRVRYGEIMQDDNAKELMEDIVDEVLAGARAACGGFAGRARPRIRNGGSDGNRDANDGRVLFDCAGFESPAGDRDRRIERLYRASRRRRKRAGARQQRVVDAGEIGRAKQRDVRRF